jgi:predicted dienelactone hydrolase
MRTFEYLILILDVLLLLLLLFPNRRPRHLLLVTSIVTLVLLAVHLLVEGLRWQMTLAYLLTGGFLLAAVIQSRYPAKKQPPAWRVALLSFLGLVLVLLAAALPIILPVPRLPEPSGSYAIGTMTYHLVDENRPEIFGESPGADREMMLQVWYPAEPGTSDAAAPWFDQLDVAASVISERLGLPSFFLGHLNLVNTHSLTGALPNSDADVYPLLLFSHGFNGLRMQNTAQFEELVSHGYIIASVDHTYDSVITIMPDGGVILHHGNTVMPEEVSTIQSGRQLVSVRVQDLATVLTFLEDQNRNADSLLYGKIDLDKLGVMGHSTGGSTAIEFCAQSTRCQAVLALDSWVEPLSEATIGQPLSQPSMFINSNEWLGNENHSIGKTFIDLQDQDNYQVTIEEMGHNNFSDIPLLTPMAAQIGLGGPINGARGIQIVNDYSLAFFNRYLLDSDRLILDKIADRYWEVTFQSN